MHKLMEPALASPEFDSLVDRHGLLMLRKDGNLSIVNGDLALTKDGDLRLGDVPFNALFRLVEHWRHNAPHLHRLYSLASMMLLRQDEAQARLVKAAEIDAAHISATGRIERSPGFLEAWHAHWNEEGAAVFGNQTYAGCSILLAASALLRFKDDLDAIETDWRTCGPLFGGRSVGQIVVPAANGFRHEDEWAKFRVATSRQKQSQDVLTDALGPRNVALDSPPPGRCPEVLALLAGEDGFDGFTGHVLTFAYEMAQSRRKALENTKRTFGDSQDIVSRVH